MESTLYTRPDVPEGEDMTTSMMGALIALGIGLGAASAASMGPAGYVLGLGAALLPMGARMLRGRDGR